MWLKLSLFTESLSRPIVNAEFWKGGWVSFQSYCMYVAVLYVCCCIVCDGKKVVGLLWIGGVKSVDQLLKLGCAFHYSHALRRDECTAFCCSNVVLWWRCMVQ